MSSSNTPLYSQAVRSKRGAAAKDVIPDDSFLRLRGALFFGASFLVTRNKLTFRDNLQELLAAAVPSESEKQASSCQQETPSTRCTPSRQREGTDKEGPTWLKLTHRQHVGHALNSICDPLWHVVTGHSVRGVM